MARLGNVHSILNLFVQLKDLIHHHELELDSPSYKNKSTGFIELFHQECEVALRL